MILVKALLIAWLAVFFLAGLLIAVSQIRAYVRYSRLRRRNARRGGMLPLAPVVRLDERRTR